MNKPTVSPDFTVDDIRALREHNALRHKTMTAAQLSEDTRRDVEWFEGEMERLRECAARGIPA